ncbi:Protein CBG04733 [Caenorhabditis briggsae]|uniref:Protein CBG04733 n=1 Tax=Caenorhabditis briggsae TaxID=6238 RepID=A8WYC3_CAEBR|nr:Protein CBG04733 [Caenorhabditis briggsae]CAP25381.1 Protein CBG04733 [Caenorhabditis briggsae]
MYRAAGLVALLALYGQAVLVEEWDNINVPSTIYLNLGANATIGLPVSANYRREIRNCTTTCNYDEQLYRVCNEKNKKTCGYWESVKTKKKVASGKTTYNKNKKALIIKNMKESDFGKYMTGNKKTSRYVEQIVSFGK